jgi:hypothetical protein
MKQDLNNKNIDKNFKLMVLSAIVLVVLFSYTIYKSSTNIQGVSYYIGVGFLFILLILSFVLRAKQEKIRDYFLKKRGLKQENSLFEKELQEKNSSYGDSKNIDFTIKPVSSNITFKDVAEIYYLGQNGWTGMSHPVHRRQKQREISSCLKRGTRHRRYKKSYWMRSVTTPFFLRLPSQKRYFRPFLTATRGR